jgi:hypothetical protein
MRIKFDSTEYQAAHGKTPAGWGIWGFRIPALVGTELDSYSKGVFMLTSSTYSDAKKCLRFTIMKALRERDLMKEMAVEGLVVEVLS